MKSNYTLLFIFSSFFSANAQDAKSDFLLIPYRVENKWGLADTLGTIKINPEYDDILEINTSLYHKKSFYFFKSGGKTILVDDQNKRYLQEYDSIDNKTEIIYHKGKVGIFIDYQPKEEVNFIAAVPPDYDKIERTEPGSRTYIVTKGKKKGVVDVSPYEPVEFLLEVRYDSIVKQKNNWTGYGSDKGKPFTDVYRFEGASDEYDVAPSHVNKEKKAEEARRLKLEKDKQKTIENLTRDATAEDLKSITPITVQPFTLNVSYKENGKMGIASYYYALGEKEKTLLKQIIVKAQYDSIAEIGLYRFMIKDKGKYGILTSPPFLEVLPTEYDSIQYYPPYAEHFIVKKGKKYALYSLGEHKFLTDFVIDKYRFKSSQNGYYLLVERGGKKGIKLSSGGFVQPVYDDIIFEKSLVNPENVGFIKLKLNGKYGVLDTGVKDQIGVPVEFDDVCVMPETGLFITTKNNLKGGYSANHKINIPPKYKSIRLFNIIPFPKEKSFLLFEVITQEGKKIFVGANGKEFYQSDL